MVIGRSFEQTGRNLAKIILIELTCSRGISLVKMTKFYELIATTLIVGSAFLTQVLSRKFSKAVHDAHVLIRDADRQ